MSTDWWSPGFGNTTCGCSGVDSGCNRAEWGGDTMRPVALIAGTDLIQRLARVGGSPGRIIAKP